MQRQVVPPHRHGRRAVDRVCGVVRGRWRSCSRSGRKVRTLGSRCRGRCAMSHGRVFRRTGGLRRELCCRRRAMAHCGMFRRAHGLRLRRRLPLRCRRGSGQRAMAHRCMLGSTGRAGSGNGRLGWRNLRLRDRGYAGQGGRSEQWKRGNRSHLTRPPCRDAR